MPSPGQDLHLARTCGVVLVHARMQYDKDGHPIDLLESREEEKHISLPSPPLSSYQQVDQRTTLPGITTPKNLGPTPSQLVRMPRFTFEERKEAEENKLDQKLNLTDYSKKLVTSADKIRMIKDKEFHENLKQAMDYAKPWLNQEARIRGRPPAIEYEGMTPAHMSQMSFLLERTDDAIQDAPQWIARMNIRRRYLTCSAFPGEEAAVMIDVDSDQVKIVAKFQELLMNSGFSFNNLLKTDADVRKVLGDSQTASYTCCESIWKRLQREAREWELLASECDEVSAGQGDAVYNILVERITSRSAKLSFDNASTRSAHAGYMWMPSEEDLRRERISASYAGSSECSRTAQKEVTRPSPVNTADVYMSRVSNLERESPVLQHQQQSSSSHSRRPDFGYDDMGADDFEEGAGTGASAAAAPFAGTQVVSMISPAMLGLEPLPEFRGTGSKRENKEWFERFQFMADSGMWDGSRRKTTLYHYCRADAREWMTYLSREKKKTWIALADAFREEFCQDRRSAIRQYNSAVQKKSEGMLTYFRRLTNLAKRARLILRGSQEMREHLDIFYDGVRDYEVVRALKVREFNTIEEVERALKRLEEVMEHDRPRRESVDRESRQRPKELPTRPMTKEREPQLKSRPNRGAAVMRAEVVSDWEESSEEEPSYFENADEADSEEVYYAQANSRERRFPDKQTVKCGACGRTGHEAGSCWAKLTCTACSAVGHPAEYCYRKCQFCEGVHDQRGPCPMRDPIKEILKWISDGGEKSGRPRPEIPDQLLN